MGRPIHVLTVPYDSGRRDERMGRGPAVLAPAVARGRDATAEPVLDDAPFPTEVETGFALVRRLAGRVRAAAAGGRLPVVLAGNCLTAVGTLAGLGDGVGVVWLDAHGDFNTPEETATGFLDGMGLAVALGRCWSGMAAGVPGFRPTPGGHVVHLGGRAFDPGERERMTAAGVRVLAGPADVEWPAAVRGVYVHVDLDVLDPREVPANEYQPAGGLSLAEAAAAVRRLRGSLPVLAAALTAYDPVGDPQGQAAGAAVALVDGLAE